MMRLALPLVVLAAPVAAQPGTLGLPPACTAFVTVQQADCTVAHHITCSGDPAGQQYSVTIYSDGADFLQMLDADAQWMVSVDAATGVIDRLGPDPADPALVSELIDKGIDTYDYTTVTDDGTVTRYVGKEELMGRLEMIDGVNLLLAANEIRALDETGFEIWRATGTEYVSPDWRLYFGGRTDWVTPTDSYSTDGSPVSFEFPGDPGFLTTVPAYGCTG